MAMIIFLSLVALISVSPTAASVPDHCITNGSPLVRKISELKGSSFGLPGLSHLTLAGAVLHGLQDIEVWLETVSPGFGTPIHRHDCEEVFVILKGSGTIYLSSNPDSGEQFPAAPKLIPFSANTTFQIPPNNVHQVKNTDEHEDLQALVIISRPPLKVYLYDEWTTQHSAAKLVFPFPFDAECYKQPQTNDEL